MTATPNPSNGTLAVQRGHAAVRVTARRCPTRSPQRRTAPIDGGEGFIDTVGAPARASGSPPATASFNSATEGGYADIPLATVRALGNGSHTIYVHAKDAAGNWGAIEQHDAGWSTRSPPRS